MCKVEEKPTLDSKIDMGNFVIFNVSSGKSEELMFPLFQKYLNSQVRTNKLVNSIVYHPFPSRLASGIHPYFLNLLGVLFLSRMLVEFSDLYIPSCVEKKIFNLLYGVPIKKCIESMHFYSCPSSPLKTPGTIFWKSVFPTAKKKRVEKTMTCFFNIQSENMTMTWSISLFIFCMIYFFCKCDGFTVLWIISIK